jgi:hypothetical protein
MAVIAVYWLQVEKKERLLGIKDFIFVFNLQI